MNGGSRGRWDYLRAAELFVRAIIRFETVNRRRARTAGPLVSYLWILYEPALRTAGAPTRGAFRKGVPLSRGRRLNLIRSYYRDFNLPRDRDGIFQRNLSSSASPSLRFRHRIRLSYREYVRRSVIHPLISVKIPVTL